MGEREIIQKIITSLKNMEMGKLLEGTWGWGKGLLADWGVTQSRESHQVGLQEQHTTPPAAKSRWMEV